MTASIFEFTVYVQFQAASQDEARHQLADWLHRPDPDIYAVGVQNYEPREVAADDH